MAGPTDAAAPAQQLAADLPVGVELDGRLAAEVAAYVEGELGWQVVPSAGPPRPALVLADRAAGLSAASRADVPVVVIADGAVDAEALRGALLDGALDVVRWPEERTRLVEAPERARLAARAAAPARSATVFAVAGLAGGVGTSTLALAVAGVLAWAGHRTVVVGADGLLGHCGLGAWHGPDVGDLAALAPEDAAAEVLGLARVVPGVRGLAALGGPAQGHDGVGPVVAEGWPVDAVVVDRGVAPASSAVDLLVARPDRSLARVADWPAPPPVLVCGDGPLSRRAVLRLLAGPPLVWLPWSARVARAGLRGRIPAGLPGAWVRALAAALRGGAAPG